MKITVETNVNAPIGKIWRAYTTPADIKQWNTASADWHTTQATVDLRVGGVFSSRMEAKDGSFGFDFAGTYTRIVPHERIEYSFGDRTGKVEFVRGPGGVTVRVTFDAETEHPIEQQRRGWQAILSNFARHVTEKEQELSAMKINERRIALGFVGMLAAACLGLNAGHAAASERTPPPMPAMAAPPAGQYQIDKAHASLQLRVNHLGFSTYTTRFSRFDSELTFDPARLTAARVITIIDSASLEMDGAPAQCLDIVKGPQFLDTAKFPKIIFRSERVRMTGPKSMDISGTLELHGVTRPIVLTASYNGGYPGMAMDPHGRVGFSAHGSFKRSDFGMGSGIPAPGTTMGVGDLIDVSIEAEFTGPPLATSGAAPH